MRITKIATLLGASALACASVSAQVLTFEGLQNNETIGNYYDGGFGGSGSGPGPNYGITFGSDSLALISSAAGGDGNFANNPSGDTVAYFLSGSGDIMDSTGGFNTGFSFFYAANGDVGTGSVTVWSGLDGTGTELASLTLPGTPSPYTVWAPIGVTFAGTAESAVFGGAANFIAFDDITLGSSTAGSLPAPDNTGLSIYVLAALGLAGASWASRKQALAKL
jgi:hypothetical protein